MRRKTIFRTRTSKTIFLILSSSAASAAVYLFMPLITGWKNTLQAAPENISDILLIFSLALHLFWAFSLAVLKSRRDNFALKAPAGMFTASLLMFLFSYLYAFNAGLEYIQRFAQSSDILSFAPDTTTGRLYALFMYLPFIASDLAAIFILKKSKGIPPSFSRLSLTMLSAVLYSLSFPSFFHPEGFPLLAFTALVPLILVINFSKTGEGIFWAVVFGVFQTTIINYWLSTFSLVSLQAVILINLVHYLIFMAIAVPAYRHAGNFKWIVFPAAWVMLEYFRSLGFAAYPWCPLGTSQYKAASFIQTASVTGVYGISFIIAIINSSAAFFISALTGKTPAVKRRLIKAVPLLAAILAASLSGLWGKGEIARLEKEVPVKTINLSLIQQNSDPRKTDYRENLDVLKKLTNEALASSNRKTDLVVWSETAYVPNIRRWGSMAPDEHPLAKLTDEFLEYQRMGGFYLLTGNDDYELKGDGNTIERKEYNASVFFTDKGKRADTYRKIRLVPFTEYFPFRKQLPALYEILIKMDVNLWEPGIEQTVFTHPEFRFSTPICFEDIFPDYVRNFALKGADVILNISNDYWSLTETEGKQHFMTGMMRAVENRRPLVRCTASGLTGVVERTGKIRDTQPFYKPLYINTHIELHGRGASSFYLKYGDWFAGTCIAAVLFMFIKSIVFSFLSYAVKQKKIILLNKNR